MTRCVSLIASSVSNSVFTQHYGRAFKVATPDRWQVVVSGLDMVDEMRKAPDEVFGFLEATMEVRIQHSCIHVTPYEAEANILDSTNKVYDRRDD